MQIRSKSFLPHPAPPAPTKPIAPNAIIRSLDTIESEDHVFDANLTPIALCEMPYDPGLHGGEKHALAVRITEELKLYRNCIVDLSETRFSNETFTAHILAPLCRELNALGWFTRVSRDQRASTSAAPEAAEYYYTLIVSDIPL